MENKIVVRYIDGYWFAYKNRNAAKISGNWFRWSRSLNDLMNHLYQQELKP